MSRLAKFRPNTCSRENMAKENSLTILLVEDDEAAVEILSLVLALKYPRVTICTASNGSNGLQSFRANLPSIVITDANMPEMDGMRMVSEILSKHADTKIIFLTAYDDTSIMENAAKQGLKVDHYVAKPVNYKNLFAAIDSCIQSLS